MNSSLEAQDGQTTVRTRRWSARTFLLGLVVACLLPGIIGAVALFIHEYREGRAELERDTIQTARALAQAMDAQILRVQTLAQGFANADSLADGDLARFHRKARGTLEKSGLGASLALTDSTGQIILSTAREFGEHLPRHGNPEMIRGVFATGKPVVSDLFTARMLGRPIMAILVPVILRDQVAYALGVGILPEQFQAMLQAQDLPAGWVATILDSTSTIVARSRESEKYMGQKPAAEFLERRGASNEGALEFVMKDGVPVLSVYTRSALTNWWVAINIPLEPLESKLLHRIAVMASSIALLFAIGLGLAWFMGEKIARSFRALTAPALALGAGKRVSLPSVEVKEAAEVTKAMGEAAGLLRERTAVLQARERELANRSAALRQSEIRLQTLTQHAPAAIAVFDRNMCYLAASRRWLEQLQLWGKDIVGKSHYEVCPKVSEAWKEAHRRGLAGEVLRAEADRVERADGSVQWFSWEVWPWREEDGEVAGIVIAFENITERMNGHEALRRSREMLRLITDGVPALVSYVDTEYRFRLANKTYRRWFGMSPEQMIGKTIHEVLGDKAWQVIQPWMERAMAGEALSFEVEMPRPEGGTRWVSASYTPDFDKDGKVRGVSVLVNDLTERRKVDEEIRRLNADLERRVEERTAELVAANRELEGFTFAISHDLRGPLGRINSFSTMLEQQYRERLEGNGLVFLDFIRQNASRLTVLVGDLLNHARVAQKDLELRRLDVSALAQAVLQENAEDIREAGADVRFDLPLTDVMGDSHALHQVLSNVVQNALKYSSSDRTPVIEIGREERQGRIRLWVRDNGIGFDMAYHDKIFDMFKRLHTYNEYEGSGVGLALVKRAMERMGGKVWAESSPGQGAVFYLELQSAGEPAMA